MRAAPALPGARAGSGAGRRRRRACVPAERAAGAATPPPGIRALSPGLSLPATGWRPLYRLLAFCGGGPGAAGLQSFGPRFPQGIPGPAWAPGTWP